MEPTPSLSPPFASTHGRSFSPLSPSSRPDRTPSQGSPTPYLLCPSSHLLLYVRVLGKATYRCLLDSVTDPQRQVSRVRSAIKRREIWLDEAHRPRWRLCASSPQLSRGGTELTPPPHKGGQIRWTARGPLRPKSPPPSARKSWSAPGPRQTTGCCRWFSSARGRRCWQPSRFTCLACISTGSRSSSTGERWASSKPSLATRRTRRAAECCSSDGIACTEGRQQLLLYLPVETEGEGAREACVSVC